MFFLQEMVEHNPTDRNKMGTKRHILTDKNSISLSVAISSASTQDIKLVIVVIDNAVIHERPPPSYKTKRTGRRSRKRCHKG